MLSIEITRECPLRCPGCYAYGDSHLGEGAPNLRNLSDLRGEDLVNGILRLVDEHQPLQLSLVGGEPMMRHRELASVLPELSQRGVYTMVVTSAVIPIPSELLFRSTGIRKIMTSVVSQRLTNEFCGTLKTTESTFTGLLSEVTSNSQDTWTAIWIFGASDRR